MLSYPPPIPFSPTQEDLDRLVAALSPEHRSLAQAEADDTRRRALETAPLRWDRCYSFNHRRQQFLSPPGMGIQNVALRCLVSLFVIVFRLVLLPFQLAILVVRWPTRPARDSYHLTAAGTSKDGAGFGGGFTPVRLAKDEIRTFEDLLDKVISFERMLEYSNYGSTRRMDLRAICAEISPRLVEPKKFANLKRNLSVKAANERRHAHFVGKANVTFKERSTGTWRTKPSRAFINRLTLEQQEAIADRERQAILAVWAMALSGRDDLCPSSFRYEYHAVDAKPHTVRIVFDFTTRILRTSRHEVRHLERETGFASQHDWKVNSSPDYLLEEEMGHFERQPSADLWREFAEYLIAEKLHERSLHLGEAPVRPVSWTLDVEFGDYEVHLGDSQTGPLGDKISLMVGRLIA